MVGGKGWEERPDINDEKQTSSTSFGYNIGDFSVDCWLDASEKLEIFKLYMYFSEPKVPFDRVDEITKFVSGVTNRLLMGSLQFLPEERVIQQFPISR